MKPKKLTGIQKIPRGNFASVAIVHPAQMVHDGMNVATSDVAVPLLSSRNSTWCLVQQIQPGEFAMLRMSVLQQGTAAHNLIKKNRSKFTVTVDLDLSDAV